MAKAKAKSPPKPAGTKALNMNIDVGLLGKVEKYRFQRMFPSKTEAVEALLAWPLTRIQR